MKHVKNPEEIGSEFWIEQIPEERGGSVGFGFVLSGRTAIDVILQDIEKEYAVGSVYMPAYCCNSMLKPFVEHGYDIVLYDISFADSLLYDVDMSRYVTVFYVTNYFGYDNTLEIEKIKRFKEKGAVVIYDNTHSLFKEKDEVRQIADYTFASIRKWLGVVTGAMVTKREGIWNLELKPCPFWLDKARAMYDKYRYLNGDEAVDKHAFLDRFGVFNRNLESDYKNYEMDACSYGTWLACDKEEIKRKRRINAEFIHSSLQGVKAFDFLGDFKEEIVPLFVSIIFKSEELRDFVRQKLILNKIYCPIHWTKNIMLTPSMRVNDVFSRELSLICDQRYSPFELKNMVDIIVKSV